MTYPINTNIPNANDYPGDDQPGMQTNFSNISGYLTVDHVQPGTSGDGFHKQVTFNSNNVPVPAVSPPVLFTNTVSGLPQLFFYSGDATHSANQYNINEAVPGTAGTGGSTFLLGGIILKWGVVAALDNTSISFSTNAGAAFPNACFGVMLTLYTASSSAANALILSVSPTPSASAFTPRIRKSDGTTASATICYVAIGN